jgi:hypothetical protein
MVLTNQTEGGLFVSSSWSRYLGLSAAHAPFDSDGFDRDRRAEQQPKICGRKSLMQAIRSRSSTGFADTSD